MHITVNQLHRQDVSQRHKISKVFCYTCEGGLIYEEMAQRKKDKSLTHMQKATQACMWVYLTYRDHIY